MDKQDLNELRSVEELANYQKDVRGRITELDTEFRGLPFPDEAREEYAGLKDEDQEITKRSTELNARKRYLEEMADKPGRTERVDDDIFRGPRPSSREADIYDLSTVPRHFGSPERGAQELRDRAMRAIELKTFGHTDRAEAQSHIASLVDYHDDEQGTIAQRILQTGSPVYARAFMKAIAQKPLSPDEARALSLTGAAGGFAVPFDLDPTIIGTSNGSVNPLRAISRVIPITVDEWRGVSSGAITTAYAAEASETTDNAPTLAQPTISTEKAQAFIPFSIEVGMDWPSLQAEMGGLLQESKDDLEAVKFFLGSGTNEPFGVIVGATNTVNATTPQTMDAEDFYRLSAALPPRYQSRASIVANRSIFNLVRQFVLTGQSNPWKDLGDATSVEGRVGTLLGYPAYESSAMDASPATGNEMAILGDFSRFVIVDRVGLQVELIQHIVGTNHRPTGQRGLYAFWRNGSKVVDANAFRVLLGIA